MTDRNVGFAYPNRRTAAVHRRRRACAELVTTVAIVFSIVVAATAVSIGIARADMAAAVAEGVCISFF